MKDVELETMLKNQANYLAGFNNTKTAFIETLSEDKLSTPLDPSSMLKIIRLAHPNTVKADLVKEWPMGGIHKYELTKCKGKKFVESFEVWLRQFDTDSTESVVYGNSDEAYDIKGIRVKQYMLERLES